MFIEQNIDDKECPSLAVKLMDVDLKTRNILGQKSKKLSSQLDMKLICGHHVTQS